jgi:hypothetical protein
MPLATNLLSLLCLVIFSLAVGCTPARTATRPVTASEKPRLTDSTPNAQVETISVPPPRETSTMLPNPTRTVTPRPTATSTLTPLPPSATATLTLTPLPTLGEAERDQALKEYMKTNGSCTLPCFWGFNSNVSSWSDVLDFLEHLNLITDRFPLHVDGIDGYYDITFTLMNNLEFQGSMKFFIREDQIVQLISFGSNDLRQASYYSARNIMRDLGVPAYIGVDLSLVTEGSPGSSGYPDPASITILIAYEKDKQTPWLGRPWALFYFTGAAHKVGTQYRFCPTDLGVADAEWPPDFVSLRLQSPESAVKVDELAAMYGKRNFSAPPDIEAVTGISVQEVYDRIMENQGQVCFDTPIDFWTK